MRYSAPDQGEKARDQRGLQRSGNFIFPWSSQRCFGKMAIAKTIDFIGAGERNRTAVISLEGIWKSFLDQRRLRLFQCQKLSFWGKS